MQILVTASSKHGATAEIADAIARRLSERGHRCTSVPPDEVTNLNGFDAAVIGSAVYAGHWMHPALALADRLGGALAGMPVWLFSSGPVGDPPEPDEDPVDVSDLIAALDAKGHRLFAGRLERSRLSFAERALVGALRAPEGDFRDWEAIRAWADEIADHLEATAA